MRIALENPDVEIPQQQGKDNRKKKRKGTGKGRRIEIGKGLYRDSKRMRWRRDVEEKG